MGVYLMSPTLLSYARWVMVSGHEQNNRPEGSIMCDLCDQEHIENMIEQRNIDEHMEEQHEIDLIAVLDPEPGAARDFKEWSELCGWEGPVCCICGGPVYMVNGSPHHSTFDGVPNPNADTNHSAKRYGE
jgi:hypothetical protein